MTTPHPVHRIELRLREVAQLFNSMDPTPFHHQDLDRDAEEFIDSWALEYPPGSRFHVTVHVESRSSDQHDEVAVTEALHNFYSYKTELARRELSQLLWQGRLSLLIGLAFLVTCLLAANLIGAELSGTTAFVAREGLIIVGWVAMWRPLEIFLYDWWPLARRQRTFGSLARAHVSLVQTQKQAAPHAPPAGDASGRTTRAADSHHP